ncbi:HAD family hydrolase [Brachybacterium paraconglomeratum]|uniref:HAD family hydrolase n=1 Tax=Brachybacterium paraconglomeratum TaxID=173362 RepID=UPI003FD13D0C
MLWGDLVGEGLPEPLRAALRLDGAQLSLALHRAKSLPAPRPGALELIRWCREQGVVVGIVSNTISGRGVREILARYGVLADLGPSAYSDEIGVRKPGREIFEAALAGLETEPADVVYVGDKTVNDGRGGKDAGIGTVCLLRGGKDSDESLEEALANGLADHLLDSPDALIELLVERLREAARPSPAAEARSTTP